MELTEYRFDEVTINFDKKRVTISGAQREKRQRVYAPGEFLKQVFGKENAHLAGKQREFGKKEHGHHE